MLGGLSMFSRILAHGIFFYFHLKRYWQCEMLKYLKAQRGHDVKQCFDNL